MDIERNWEKALQNTEIIRSRIQLLLTTGATSVPYILLSESTMNIGDTVVRKGEVLVDRPALIIPPNHPQFDGFEFDTPQGQDSIINFLLVRGITIPSMKYDNKTSSLDVYEGKLSRAIQEYKDLLHQQENVHTGLIAGPEDCWQFSLLIFICSQIARNADHDIRKLLQDYHKRNPQG